MPIQPRMFPTAPAEVFLHDTMHFVRLSPFQAKRGRQHDVLPVVEDGIVVTKAYVARVDQPAFSLLAQDVARFKDLRDEHRPLPFWSGREEVQVLPDRAADGTRDANVVLETRPAQSNRFLDEIFDNGAALGSQPTVCGKTVSRRRVANDQSPKSTVADEDVSPQSEDEMGHFQFSGD